MAFSKSIFNTSTLLGISNGSSITPDQLKGTDISAAGGAGFSASTWFLYNTGNGELFYDSDGIAGGAVEISKLSGNPDILNTNILMIT